MYTEKISNGESEVQQVSPTSFLPAAAQWHADESTVLFCKDRVSNYSSSWIYCSRFSNVWHIG